METQRRAIIRSLNLRTFKYGSHFTLMVMAVLVILYAMVVNHNRRFDVTRVKRFTLAAQSIELLTHLAQPIKVTGFFRLESAERQRFEDLLRHYTHHTEHVTYDLIDLDRQPALAQRYDVTAYNTIVVAGADKKEKISRLEEEALTNAILRVTRDIKKVVYFVTGHGEPAINDSERTGYSLAKQGLEKQNYTVRDLLLARQQQVPDDAAVVIVAGIRTDLLEPELQALTDYLESGGHLLFMLDPNTASGLVPFLRRYGFELGDDVVIETNAFGRLFGGDYHMPAITTYEQHPITRDLGSTMTIFPVVRSVRITEKLPEGVSMQALASTSPQSWAETDVKALQEGRSTFDTDSDRKGPISVAVVATIPVRESGRKQHPDSLSTSDNSVRNARFVVFGDSEFANNNFFTLQGNGNLFLSTVSWLAEEEDLIAIRPREGEGGGEGPVVLTAAQQPLIFWLPVVLLPLAVFVSGAVVLIKRRWQR